MQDIKICVVGLGYVGLPLAIHFAQVFPTIGFDIKGERIEQLKKFNDITKNIPLDVLKNSSIEFTSNPIKITSANFIIVAVPTPIHKDKTPDLSLIEQSSKIVGQNLSKGSIVVYESTVYPGVIEEICCPILERESGLKCIKDFKVGYSPERINPGDNQHTIDKIIKLVSGIDEESQEIISLVYSKIVKAGVFKVKNIKTAEAAKVIENIQRDLNIALMNEFSIIFSKMGIETKDVIDAAGTKWNFHNYHPGLVGGHCIGVDPYYLAYKSNKLGYYPKVILAGRELNEYMSKYVSERIIKFLNEVNKEPKISKVLIMGLTFKENLLDTRNSKVSDLIFHLSNEKVSIVLHDPLLSNEDVKVAFGFQNSEFKSIHDIDCIVLFSPHNSFKNLSIEEIKSKMVEKSLFVDIKGFFDKEKSSKFYEYWSL